MSNQEPVPVAEQRAAGVAPKDTVTLADQAAGQAVPADFEAAAVNRDLSSAQLSPEEVAEFRALRAEKKAHDERVAKEAEEAAANLQPLRHHVHLADGSIVDGSSIESHVDNGDGPVQVIGAYLKAEFASLIPA